MIEVASLSIYPVKSLSGISLKESVLTTRGLKYDRNWMVIDADGKLVTQREIPKMATIIPSINKHHLILEHQYQNPLKLALVQSDASKIQVLVWDDWCQAFDCGEEASDWLTDILGNWKGGALRLVRFSDQYKRFVENGYLKPDETSHTAFADGYPFLVTSESSLDHLNHQLVKDNESKIPMNRFRPNIVITGIDALAEHNIDELSNDRYSIGLRKPCERCKITTIDQGTSEIPNPKQPLKALVSINPFSDKRGAFFGQNSILISGEGNTIKVGDILTDKQ